MRDALRPQPLRIAGQVCRDSIQAGLLGGMRRGLQDRRRRHTEPCATGVCWGSMKRKLAAIVVVLLLVGTFMLFQWFSRSAQAHWAASATPRPAEAPSVALESPQQSRWTATATVPPSSSNSATPTNTSLPVKCPARRLSNWPKRGRKFLTRGTWCYSGRYSLAVPRRRRPTLRSPMQKLRTAAPAIEPFPADLA